MIAVSSKSRSFASLGRYLVEGRAEENANRVEWSASRNLPTDDPELAATIMRATASQNVRVDQPVYHLTLSFDPGDPVNQVAMERVADRVLEALGLQEHQVLIVAHGDREHPHMHVLINRVHPETGKVWSRWQDYAVIQRVLREEERTLGLREVPGRLGDQLALDLPRTEMPAQDATAPGRRPTPEELGKDLQAYERVIDMGRRRYTADMEVLAAKARLTQIDAAIERAHTTEDVFRRTLTSVYPDPDSAIHAFYGAAERSSTTDAVRTMRHTPEQFGALHMVERRSFMGRQPDDSAARTAAATAATAGQEAAEARHTLQAMTAERTVATAAVQHAETRAQSLRRAQGQSPSRSLLERTLSRGLRQLSPPEFNRLRFLVTGAQFSLARKLRHVARDVVLGRDEAG